MAEGEKFIVDLMDDGVIILHDGGIAKNFKADIEAVDVGIEGEHVRIEYGITVVGVNLNTAVVVVKVEEPILETLVGIIAIRPIGFGNDVVQLLGIPSLIGHGEPHFSEDDIDVGQDLEDLYPLFGSSVV